MFKYFTLSIVDYFNTYFPNVRYKSVYLVLIIFVYFFNICCIYLHSNYIKLIYCILNDGEVFILN
jgi:hypothetical protein